jgi:hypothetical protein
MNFPLSLSQVDGNTDKRHHTKPAKWSLVLYRKVILSHTTDKDKKFTFKEKHYWLGVVAQLCNPSYLRGRDWEYHGSKLE